MVIPSSGQVSIKDILDEKQGSTTAQTNVSLKGLSVNGVNDYQNTDISGTPNAVEPYGIAEFHSYSQSSLWETTGTVTKYEPGGKISIYYVLTLSDMTPDNAGGQFNLIRSYRGGAGMWMEWISTLNTSWVSIRIGTSSSSYTTLTRTGDFAVTSGSTHYSDASTGTGGSDPAYITNTDNATMYFALQT